MDLELSADKKYLIAVSGGPDSMALLDMAFHHGAYIEAAHMNYHRRDSADRDEKIAADYCLEHDIPFHRCDYDENRYRGNFQAAAREARYDFFAEICREAGLDEVLVAHQEDDLIETYLMQKEKKLGVSCYGLRQSNVINGITISRPLLKYTKQQLCEYCDEHHIPYGIDESNLSDDYQRNYIRHHKVSKMDPVQREKIISEITRQNQKKKERCERAASFLSRDSYTPSAFLRIPYLDHYLHEHYIHRSKNGIKEMKRQLKESEKCAFYGKDILICKEYGKIHLSVLPEIYSYRFDDISEMNGFDCRVFSLKDDGEKIEGVALKEDDFPIVIRNYEKGDRIAMRYGHKKVSRFLIDSKILMKNRVEWPVMENRRGDIIFVPGMGCDKDHYSENHSIFMIKL